MKIITIIGARPQFIKAAVVSRAFNNHNKNIEELIIHTGQHYDKDMSDVFFDELDIPKPHYNLEVGGGSHGQNTGRMLEKIETVLLTEKPDFVLVYGDTDSTLAGALAASKLHIPVVHVEAGLRSFNKKMPEELNRILTDHVSSILVTPTTTASENLANEGVNESSIKQFGDVMFDAVLYFTTKAEKSSNILSDLKIKPKEYVLATIHRAENTDSQSKLSQIIEGLSKSNYPIVWPMHPRTRTKLKEFNIELPEIINTINPLGYLDIIMLEKNALTIATDSGGMQKEAYFHNVPCITLREETEWVELISKGVNTLVGTDPIKISESINNIQPLNKNNKRLYGDGTAGEKIYRCITEF